jgi:diguanylate cyclase (GGDEF)-like protein
MKIKLTLQNRITTLVVVSILILVSAFTAIQLNNQLVTITIHNSYRARLGGLIIKTTLEKSLMNVSRPEDQLLTLKAALNVLTEGKMMEDTLIFSVEGEPLLSSQPFPPSLQANPKDSPNVKQSLRLLEEKKWFLPVVGKRAISLYLPLLSGASPIYVAKATFSLGNMTDAMAEVYKPTLLTTFVVIVVNVILAFILSKTVIGPIGVLNNATKVIAAGDLTMKVNIKTNDELEELSDTFNYMTQELVKMKERAENANPLTKLPGNIVIREEAEKRIREGTKFVVFHTDLDNFKAYNDKYGLANGDEAIKLCADVLKEAMKAKGNSDDLLGHEGGDDFVLITTPDKAEEVGKMVTAEFDKKITPLYNEEDRQRGYIVAHSRDGELKKFPIMAISIAGVSNEKRSIASYAEITNITAEVKKKAKSIEGSVYLIDRRT